MRAHLRSFVARRQCRQAKRVFGIALFAGLVASFASGVDFADSRRRFAPLTQG
jgi:hypothetical protein